MPEFIGDGKLVVNGRTYARNFDRTIDAGYDVWAPRCSRGNLGFLRLFSKVQM